MVVFSTSCSSLETEAAGEVVGIPVLAVEEVNDLGVDDIVGAPVSALLTATAAADGSEEMEVDDAVVGIGGIGGMDGGGGVGISVVVTATGVPVPSALVETK